MLRKLSVFYEKKNIYIYNAKRTAESEFIYNVVYAIQHYSTTKPQRNVELWI